LVEQYKERHYEVFGTMFDLPASEGGASETGRDVKVIAYIEVKVE
jgi:hypothetical protein